MANLCNGRRIRYIGRDWINRQDSVYFVFEDGTKLRMNAYGECCSESFFRLPKEFCSYDGCHFFARSGCFKCDGTICWIEEGNSEDSYPHERPDEDNWASFSESCSGMMVVSVEQGEDKVDDNDYTKKTTDITLTLEDKSGRRHKRKIVLVNLSNGYYSGWFDIEPY